MAIHRSINCPDDIAMLAAREAERGARVLIIRNTVISAQEVFRALVRDEREDLFMKVNGVPTLHHSRFAAKTGIVWIARSRGPSVGSSVP